MMPQIEKITFARNGLKSEGRILRRHESESGLFLVDTPAGETWVFEDELICEPFYFIETTKFAQDK